MIYPLISIIIPSRVNEKLSCIPYIENQTYRNIEILIKYDYLKQGAGRIRNELARGADGEFLFFCDNDVNLHPNCIYDLFCVLNDTIFSFAFCKFKLDSVIVNENKGQLPARYTDYDLFKYCHFISTMSLIKTSVFHAVGGFDDKLRRFVDWDLWLRLTKNNFFPIFVDKVLFSTESRADGLSTGTQNLDEWQMVVSKLINKHKIPCSYKDVLQW